MTKKQFRGLVDCLENVCIFNTTNSYSFSLREIQNKEFYHASILVFPMSPYKSFCSSDIEIFLSLAEVWNVTLYSETVNGVTVAKFI